MVSCLWLCRVQLRADFEEDKQQAVSRAMGKLQSELDRVRQKTEERCKEQYKDEMKKLAQKHKDTISQTKKKQWVSNTHTHILRQRGCGGVRIELSWKKLIQDYTA